MILLLLFWCTTAHALFDEYHARQAYQAGDVTKAQKIYEQEILDNCDNTRALINRGTIDFNAKKYQDAVNWFEKAVAVEPDNAIAQERLAKARELLKKQEEEKKKQQDDKDKQDKQDQDKKQQDQEQKQDKKDKNNTQEQKPEHKPQDGAQQKEQKAAAEDQRFSETEQAILKQLDELDKQAQAQLMGAHAQAGKGQGHGKNW